MRVITPPGLEARGADPNARGRASKGWRSSAVELLGLLAATAVAVSGIVLTYAGQSESLPAAERDLASGVVLELSAMREPSDLDSRLTMFTSPFERDAVARVLYRRATSEAPLDRVGDLALVTIPAAEIRKDSRFVELRARLKQHPDLERVPVLTATDLAAIKQTTVVRTPSAFRHEIRVAVLLFVAAFWAGHVSRRYVGRSQRARHGRAPGAPTDGDPLLLPTLMVLSGIGLMAMIALRDPLRDTLMAYAFAQGVAAGVVLLVVLSSMDFESSPLRRAFAVPLLAALALAALLLLLGTGPGQSGAKVNLFGVQPVEAIRLLVIFALAGYFSHRLEFLRELSQPASRSHPWIRSLQMPRWKDVRPVIVGMALVLAFFFLQKDLGPALVLSFVFLALYGIARGRAAGVLAGVSMLFAAFFVAHRFGFPPTVRQRVAIWMDPWSNGVRGGDQIAHSLWALATGAVSGTGPGLGDPKLIPAGHTDFVLAAIGEELGWIGVIVVVALYVILCWRCLRIATRAAGDYTAFLSIGVGLGLIVQAIVIAGGLTGLLPLAGVVTPFLSYGRSSMLANFAAVGIVLGVARRPGVMREHFTAPVRVLGNVLAAAALVIVARTGWIQLVEADRFAVTPSLGEQADGAVRFQYNPRLLSAARLIVRGTIYDRHHLPLATSRPDEMKAAVAQYREAGVEPIQTCDAAAPRCYPLAGEAFHVVGNAIHQTNWAARNSSFIERDDDVRLKGFDDRAQAVDVWNPRTGELERTVRRDYHEVLPLLRNRYRPDDPEVQAFLNRNRDIDSSLDARLQLRAAAALERGIRSGGFSRGAAIVMDVATGEVLAAVSYPWPESADMIRRDAASADDALSDRLLDRTRYGLYPPGSTFKMLMAAVALRTAEEHRTFFCIRLPDGRVGNYVGGSRRPVRDDPMDRPHGAVDLHRGLVVSCNAYFAQLALRIGPQPLLDAASIFQIDVAHPATPASLRRTLAQAGYGQGQVIVSPVKMARIAAAIARDGRVPQARWAAGSPPRPDAEPRLVGVADAVLLGRYMRDVVTTGTGRVLASNATPIAGKTGTAEVDNGRAHSWFAGFAPYGGPTQPRIAFAVIVENAGYGARSAAPIAGDLVTAARELGIIK